MMSAWVDKTSSRADIQEAFCKNGYSEIFVHRKARLAESFLVQIWKPFNLQFYWKSSLPRVFPVNFPKIFRAAFLPPANSSF